MWFANIGGVWTLDVCVGYCETATADLRHSPWSTKTFKQLIVSRPGDKGGCLCEPVSVATFVSKMIKLPWSACLW